MDKKLLGALGGVTALALLGGTAMAAPSPTETEAPSLQPARSFGDLLEPIPNALSVLKAEDSRAAAASAQNGVQLAQFDVEIGGGDGGYYHHHHHHFRRFYGEGYQGYDAPRFYPRYHHHHHHHFRVFRYGDY